MRTIARLGTSVGLVMALAASVALAERQDGSADGRYLVKFRDFRSAAGMINAAGGTVAIELVPQNVIAVHLPQQELEA